MNGIAWLKIFFARKKIGQWIVLILKYILCSLSPVLKTNEMRKNQHAHKLMRVHMYYREATIATSHSNHEFHYVLNP
jgi:hypothetical protein